MPRKKSRMSDFLGGIFGIGVKQQEGRQGILDERERRANETPAQRKKRLEEEKKKKKLKLKKKK